MPLGLDFKAAGSLTRYSTELPLMLGLICAMEYLIRLQSRTSPAPSGSLALQHVKLGHALQICDGII